MERGKNTLIINFFGIILGLIVPISLAIFLNEMRLGIYKRVVQSVMFFRTSFRGLLWARLSTVCSLRMSAW